ncbi:MAG: methylenetetrahydrofolate reductase [Rhodobacter sp.]|nr:methylenetetrahydrofolate reductase [Paracoccaceae bacterium]MCC0078495.1 methylenetetrahydrofolate reductase [Rhodobacter sp.]
MALFNLRSGKGASDKNETLAAFLDGASIEVMPRTAAKIDSFTGLLPAGTRVYVAHIEGTSVEDMADTVGRLAAEGFAPMPHIPARSIATRAALVDRLTRYRAAGAEQALVLAGNDATPAGEFTSSMDMLETGVFQDLGYTRLHVAGHPEGNKDIDRKGGTAEVDRAILWKQEFAARTGIEMAITTQFAFDAGPVIAWAERLAGLGVTLPIHLGAAGPTKLQTLIKYAVACGVGPSMAVLQKRALDLSKLLVPFAPTELLTEVAQYKSAHPDSLIARVHLFPLGGIKATAEWLGEQA